MNVQILDFFLSRVAGSVTVSSEWGNARIRNRFNKVHVIAAIEYHETGQGQLTELLDLVNMHLTGAIVVECVHNTRLLNHLLSRGFTPFGENHLMLIL